MKKALIVSLFLTLMTLAFGQNKDNNAELKTLKEKIEQIKYENQNLQNNYNNLTLQYQQTNDRLNNYLTFTAIVASIFGVLIALAGIYIGFESLRSQNRRKDAIKTLEDAKNYVNDKKTEFDTLIVDKKELLQSEYDKITQIIKDKLLSDIEIETSKVRLIAEKKTEEIQNLSVEEQTNKTIELLEKRLEFFENIGIPDDPEILFSKSKILREKKMHKEAILLLEKLVEKVPLHKEAYWYLGYEYAELVDNDNSIKNYKKQLELNPTDSSAFNNIALRYKAKGNLLASLENLTKAIENSSKKELYYTNRIDVLKKLNSNERAIDDYVQLILINPDKAEYYNEIITLLRKENRNNDVIDFFDKAINHFKEKEPDASNSFSFSKATYLGENGKEQEAIEILQKLIDANYKIESCYINIADLKNKIGETDEAINILTNGISNNPLSSVLYIYKAFIEASISESNSKATIDNGGKSINTENYYYIAGRFFYQKEKFELAKHSYEGALKIIEPKLLKEKIKEGDLMNYYETMIILQKPLQKFNDEYRSLIVSEKYLIVLTVLDNINRLYFDFNITDKEKALVEIKNLNIEAKDKDLINWNFSDIYRFVEKTKGGDLATFANNLIKYIQREIKFDEL